MISSNIGINALLGKAIMLKSTAVMCLAYHVMSHQYNQVLLQKFVTSFLGPSV
jgi:hypothetical protein